MLQVFDLERGNVEAGWKWSKEVVKSSRADRLRIRAAANALTRYFVFAGDVLRDRFPAAGWLEWYQACLDASRHPDVNRGFAEADALGNIGICYRALADSSDDKAAQSRNLKKAVKFHKGALEMAQRIKSKVQQIYWLGNLARDYNRLASLEVDRSEGLHDEALSLLERRITICEQEAERFEKIRQKLKASDPHYNKRTGMMYSRYLGNAYVDKGLALKEPEDGTQQRTFLNNGIKCLEGVGDRPGLIFAYRALAHLERQAEHYTEARHNFKEMERVATECGRHGDAAEALRGIADVLWELGKENAADAEEAISTARHAARRFRNVGDNENANREDDRANIWERSLTAPDAPP